MVEHADQHRGITLAWWQLCKGPEAGMFLAEASSWRGEEGAREEEATITRFGRAVDTGKTCFLLSPVECETRESGTGRWRVVLEV